MNPVLRLLVMPLRRAMNADIHKNLASIPARDVALKRRLSN